MDREQHVLHLGPFQIPFPLILGKKVAPSAKSILEATMRADEWARERAPAAESDQTVPATVMIDGGKIVQPPPQVKRMSYPPGIIPSVLKALGIPPPRLYDCSYCCKEKTVSHFPHIHKVPKACRKHLVTYWDDTDPHPCNRCLKKALCAQLVSNRSSRVVQGSIENGADSV